MSSYEKTLDGNPFIGWAIWLSQRGDILSKVPNIVVEPPGPNAKEIIKVDNEYLATSTKTAPIVVESAKGALVKDVDGNTFIDFASGVAVLNVGHCHPKVVKAVQDQAAKVMHFAGTDYYYQVQSDLVKRLCEISPWRPRQEGLPEQLWNRIGGGGDEAGPMEERRAQAVHRFHRGFPRSDHGLIISHSEQEGATGALLPHGPWCHAHPLCLLLPLPLQAGVPLVRPMVRQDPEGDLL